MLADKSEIKLTKIKHIFKDAQTRTLVLGLGESLAEAGERLCRPDASRELIPPLRCQNREELGLGRAMVPCS